MKKTRAYRTVRKVKKRARAVYHRARSTYHRAKRAVKRIYHKARTSVKRIHRKIKRRAKVKRIDTKQLAIKLPSLKTKFKRNKRKNKRILKPSGEIGTGLGAKISAGGCKATAVWKSSIEIDSLNLKNAKLNSEGNLSVGASNKIMVGAGYQYRWMISQGQPGLKR